MEWAIGIFILVGAILHLMAYRYGMSFKKSMFCIFCESNDQRLKVQQLLSQAGLMHTNLPWSSSQEGLTTPGTQPAQELWIQKKDIQKVKEVLLQEFQIKETEFALKISSKK